MNIDDIVEGGEYLIIRAGTYETNTVTKVVEGMCKLKYTKSISKSSVSFIPYTKVICPVSEFHKSDCLTYNELVQFVQNTYPEYVY